MVSAWLGHIGRAWTGEPSDIAAALQHVHQAIQFLLRVRNGKALAAPGNSLSCCSCIRLSALLVQAQRSSLRLFTKARSGLRTNTFPSGAAHPEPVPNGVLARQKQQLD
jgi:hypothetical protein